MAPAGLYLSMSHFRKLLYLGLFLALARAHASTVTITTQQSSVPLCGDAGYVRESQPTNAKSVENNWLVGFDSNNYRGLLRFNLFCAASPGDVVCGAKIQVFVNAIVGTDNLALPQNMRVHNLL